VKTIRSRLSTARKQPLTCGMKSPPSSLISVTNEPPGRSSISTTLHLAGAGIHHCSKRRGSVQARQTAALGASFLVFLFLLGNGEVFEPVSTPFPGGALDR
jgi:hypothetical protein